jgi:hypothetical protein
MPVRVKMPDGSVAEFPDGMAPADIEKAITEHMASATTDNVRPAGLPEGVDLPGFRTREPAHVEAPVSAQLGAAANRLLPALGHYEMGGVRGLANTAEHTMALRDRVPRPVRALLTGDVGRNATPEEMSAIHDLATPRNTGEAVGRGVEQAAEFLLPTGVEEGAGRVGAGLLEHLLPEAPGAARAAGVGGRLLGGAVHSGGINAAQGGGFLPGAAMGAGGSAAGQTLEHIAVPLAEKALNVRAVDRALGRTPGRAILDETTGLTPRAVADQASQRVSDLSTGVEKALDKAPDGSLLPARQVAQDFVDTAVARNSPESIRRTGALRNVLTTKFGEDAKPVEVPKYGDIPNPNGAHSLLDEYANGGYPIAPMRGQVGTEPAEYPPYVPARTLLDLKRGVGEQAQAFNPNVPNKLGDSARAAIYHALDSQMDELAPETEGMNTRMSSLIPVGDRAAATDLNAGVLHRMLGRFGAPTGALLGMGGGLAYGEHKAGVPGALVGAGVGLAAPELLTNPTTLLTMARAADSPAAQGAIKAGEGGLLQLNRPVPQEQRLMVPGDPSQGVTPVVLPAYPGMMTPQPTRLLPQGAQQ